MYDITRKPKDITIDALTSELEELLSECTGPQQIFFMKIFPEWPGRMTEDKLYTAIELCQRTIAKNRKGRG